MKFLHTRTPLCLHRDLKSGNLLVSENLVVKVGSARVSADTPYQIALVFVHILSVVRPSCPKGGRLWHRRTCGPIQSRRAEHIFGSEKRATIDAER